MAQIILTDVNIAWQEFNLTTDHNRVALNYGAEGKDDTVFGDTTRSSKGGLYTVAAKGVGLWNSADDGVDEQLFADIGQATRLITIAPDGWTAADYAYIFEAMSSQYTVGAQVGELLPFTWEARSEGSKLIRGTVLLQNTALVASGNSAAIQLGAVTATQKIFAHLHVFGATAGDTFDAVLQSDSDQAFTTPNARATFTQVGATVTAERKSANGAITDTWWRINYTIGGVSPSYNVLVVAGIVNN